MSALVVSIPYKDDELILMIQNKNKNAFALLYDKYAPALYGSIFKLVNDKQVAEQILQQTFLEMWNLPTGQNVSHNHLLLWMMNVARSITSKTKTISGDYNSTQRIASL
jgi:RNA polymerase sigma-70 factor (ECF subfamily)